MLEPEFTNFYTFDGYSKRYQTYQDKTIEV